MDRKKVYIASPLGFSEIGRIFYYEKLIPMLQGSGFMVIDPWTITPAHKLHSVDSMEYGAGKRDAWKELNDEIAGNNTRSIDNSDMILAILDGADIDSGTAAEIGYGFAKGKRIVGYRGDFRLTGDNEGAMVNLQVEHFIRRSGGEIVTDYNEIPRALGI